MNTNDMLKNLTKTAKKTEKKTDDRPTVPVPINALDSFERLVGAKMIAEVASARQEVESAIVEEIMLDAFAETVYDNGCVPANPRLTRDRDQKPDMSGIFQVQQSYKFNIPDEVNGDKSFETRFVAALVEAGLTEENAQKLFANEIDAQPSVSIRPFNELIEGHYVGKNFIPATDAEKAVGEKLISFVMGLSAAPLTEAEKELVVVQKDKIKVKDGFMQRMKLYCKSLKQMKGLLKVITPKHYVSHMKMGISDTPEQVNHRLAQEAANLLGVSTETLKQAA